MASSTASQVYKPRTGDIQKLLNQISLKEANVSPNDDAAQIQATKHEAITHPSTRTDATKPQINRLTTLPTEILEQVLLDVDMPTVLTSQRVSTVFRDVIQDSKALRQHTWLDPPADDGLLTRSVCREHGQYCPDQMRHGTAIECPTQELPCVKLNPMLHPFLVKNGQKPGKAINNVTPIRDISPHFAMTVKQLTKLVLEHPDSSHLNMAIFSPPNPFLLAAGLSSHKLVVSYPAYEKFGGNGSSKKIKMENGEWYIERVHELDVGDFEKGVVITIKELIERVIERHRDIYMEI